MKNILYSLSPLERKVLPYVDKPVSEIKKLTGLDETSIIRAFRFLENKKIVTITLHRKVIVNTGTNGVHYKKNSLPERTLLLIIEKNKPLVIEEAQKIAKLSENEFKAALGILKRKSLVAFQNGKLSLTVPKTEITKKFPEELFLERIPCDFESLSKEEKAVCIQLKNRKEIIEFQEIKETYATLTELGKKIMSEKIETDLIEEVTPEMIKKGTKNKQFRHYDLQAQIPRIYGGRRHFVNDARNYAKRIWIEMGFKEMRGPMIDSSFWVFDALFTAQDHQVRDMQDTFYLKGYGELPAKDLVDNVKKAHQSGIASSKGWSSPWSENEASKVVLRTHTTSLSARTLASLKTSTPSKWFAIGKAFRNETIDWSHNIEFFQTEGIVVGSDLTLRHLIGYLKAFYKKMHFTDIRVRPAFFPYTEPSLEIEVYHPEREKWLELGGAGILRPEVTVPLLGTPLPVLAWGQGLDRMIMDAYDIKDLRELYANNLSSLRTKKRRFI